IRRVGPASFVQVAFAPPPGSSAIAIESARLRFAFGTAVQKMPNVQMPPTWTAFGSSSLETTVGLVEYVAVPPAPRVAVAPLICEKPMNQRSDGSFGRSESVR